MGFGPVGLRNEDGSLMKTVPSAAVAINPANKDERVVPLSPSGER